MLTQLRNSAQSWLIKLLLGLIVVTFVVSFGVVSNNNPKEVLVEVDSHEILIGQFRLEYRNREDQLRRQFPNNAEQIEALARQLNLPRQVMDQMVERYLVLKSARQEGLRVSDEEVREVVKVDKSFQISDSFNYSTYQQILQQNNYTPEKYEAEIKEKLLLQKQQLGWVAGMVVNDQEVNQRYQLENQRVEVDYIPVDPAKFKPSTTLKEAEISAYYEKNPKLFTEKPRFKVRYFVLGLSQVEAGVKIRKRAIERYYQRKKSTEFSTPKQVRISHIMMRVTKEEGPKKEKQVRAALEKVLAKSRTGEDFSKLAKKYSQDLTRKKGGDLGFFTRDDMLPTFSDTAFTLPKGGVSNVLKSPFGLHVVKVTDIKPEKQQAYDEVKGKITEILRGQRAERKLGLELERLPSKIRESGLDKVATSLQLKIQVSEEFGSSDVIKDLGSSNSLYSQVQSSRKGDTGVLRRNPVRGHVFYEVMSKKKAYVRPLKEVRADVVRILQEKQRRESALADAKKIVKALKNEGEFTAYAKNHGFPVKTLSFTVVDRSLENLGVNPDFQRSAFRLTQAKPFALNIKDGKAYLMRFKRRFFKDKKQEAELKQKIRNQLEATYRRFLIEKEVKRLEAKAEIKILRPEVVGQITPPPVAKTSR